MEVWLHLTWRCTLYQLLILLSTGNGGNGGKLTAKST